VAADAASGATSLARSLPLHVMALKVKLRILDSFKEGDPLGFIEP
jgi:hypothetical protein